MRLHAPSRGECDERGAIALMAAFLMVAFLGVAALSVDIASQVNQRQLLHDMVDASAHAGAYQLPDGITANQKALAFRAKNYPTAPVPTVSFFCVVASVSGSVDITQIPATCNPASVKSGSTYTGFKCNTRICSIPCVPAAGDVCNTVRVTDSKVVPFAFGPAIGVPSGPTGSVSSAACKGSCGTVAPNPMDVAVVADRTTSMTVNGHDYTADLVSGVKGMLQVMSPSLQYVALGTIGRSTTTTHSTATCDSSSKGLSWPSSLAANGSWVPVDFSNDYLTPGTTTIKANSSLVKAVECLTNHSSTGTHLAAPMKAAARYLLGLDANNLGSLPARTGTVRKAIIFETDGVPNEEIPTGGSTTLSAVGDISSTANDDTACNNFKVVANNAKVAGILVVTVGFNIAKIDSGDKCSSASGSPWLVDTMAAAASPEASGTASAANFDCSTVAGRNSENADGDFFFCAAPGDAMAPIFKTAFGQLAKGIRLIQLP